MNSINQRGEIPIIMWHRGNSDYLKIALRQAEKYADNVILLGDDKNKSFSDHWIDMDQYSDEKYNEFKRVYVNLSMNDDIFELRCFERYFYVLEYSKKANIERFILCDSDVLLFENLDVFFDDKTKAFSHTCSEPDGWAVSPHCALWTMNDMESFTDFLIKYYSSNKQILVDCFTKYKANHNKGGICDMTLLYLWLRDSNGKYFNTAEKFSDQNWGGNCCIDHAISVPHNGKKNEYRVSRFTGCKIVRFQKGKPYFVSNKGENVRVLALHCSGGYKNYMHLLSEKQANTLLLLYARIKLKLKSLK